MDLNARRAWLTANSFDNRRVLLNTNLVLTFVTTLEAEGKSPRTVQNYLEAVALFERYLLQGGRAEGQLVDVTADDVRAFLAGLRERCTPSTVVARYAGLCAFYRYLAADGLLEPSPNPMDKVTRPALPRNGGKLVQVVGDDTMRKLLAVCRSNEFLDLRDTALIRMMSEAGGARRAEIVGLRVSDLSLDRRRFRVLGKGSKEREISYGVHTAKALTRYLRALSRHRMAEAYPDALWLTMRGVLSGNGLYQMIDERCRQAGIDHVHPHQLRHTAAHAFYAAGGGVDEAMELFGWDDPQMPRHYARATANERAQDKARKLNIGDRF